MKTTLNIDDTVVRRLRDTAARQERTVSELVESALRRFLDAEDAQKPAELPPLPTFDGGGELVDVADRDALYRAMEE